MKSTHSQSRTTFVLFSVLLLSAVHTSAKAEASKDWQVNGAWGKGLSRYELNFKTNTRMRPDVFRLTLAKLSLYQWEIASNTNLYLDLDGSVHHLNDARKRRDISVISLVPMWRIEVEFDSFTPFLRAGIGAAVFDTQEWMDRKLGSHLLFEDKAELGIRIDNHQFSIGISHFSNANFADINHGANVHFVSYGYSW